MNLTSANDNWKHCLSWRSLFFFQSGRTWWGGWYRRVTLSRYRGHSIRIWTLEIGPYRIERTSAVLLTGKRSTRLKWRRFA